MTALAGVASALGPNVNRCGVLGGGVAHGRVTSGADRSPRSPTGDGVEVGSLGGDDGNVDEVADRQVVGHVDDAVDLGRLVHGAAPPGASTRTGASGRRGRRAWPP